MMQPMNKQQSRIMAVSLLGLAVALLVLLAVVPAYMLHRHYDQAIESRMDLLNRYQRVIAGRPAVMQALAQVKARDARKHFLKNPGAALAASEIQDTAKSLIETNGGKLVSMQVVPPKDEGGYRRISVSIQMTSTVSALRKILHTVETVQPYLLVDNVSIRSQSNHLYKNVPGVDPEVISQFDLSGYALVADSK